VKPAAAKAAAKAEHPVTLQRERRRLSDDERLETSRAASPDDDWSPARAGHDDLRAQLAQHTETSPVLTAGDVDAWQDARWATKHPAATTDARSGPC
jgi:hypothetical protein